MKKRFRIGQKIYYYARKYPQYGIEELYLSDVAYMRHDSDNIENITYLYTKKDLSHSDGRKSVYDQTLSMFWAGQNEDDMLFSFEHSSITYYASEDYNTICQSHIDSLLRMKEKLQQDLLYCDGQLEDIHNIKNT